VKIDTKGTSKILYEVEHNELEGLIAIYYILIGDFHDLGAL
jgi:hypothetical protein